MTNPVLNFFALVFYLAAAAVILRCFARGQAVTGGARAALFGIGFAAVVLHAATLVLGGDTADGIDLSLTGAAALVAWVVACLYLIVSLWRPLDNLGVFVLPLAALTVLAEWVRAPQAPVALSSGVQAVHVVVALVAYSLLLLATLQSLMLLAQDNKLRHKHPGGFVRALPSMQAMEEQMFQMIALGFALLTLTLLSGVFFSEQVFGQPFKLTHHMLLALLGWVVYAALLLGRWRLGWRGRVAVGWTLGGFTLLLLGYFGTKFVLEVLLGR